MGVLKVLLIALEIMCSFLLIGAVLLQRTKGQGMGLAFGGGMGEALFGAQVGNVLTKATVILITVFVVNTTILALLGVREAGSVTDGAVVTAPLAPISIPGVPGGSAELPMIPAQPPPVTE